MSTIYLTRAWCRSAPTQHVLIFVTCLLPLYLQGSKNCREKQRKNSTSVEDRKCLECGQYFSTTQGLASHVRTHRSLNLALSVTNSPHSQTLPVESSSYPTISSEPTFPASSTADTVVAVVSAVTTVTSAEGSNGVVAQDEPRAQKDGFVCEICSSTLKTKSALSKHKVKHLVFTASKSNLKQPLYNTNFFSGKCKV